MLQFYTADKRLVIGVTRTNITNLVTKRMPIRITTEPSYQVSQIVVVFGEDKPAILAALEVAGWEISDEWRAICAADPL